ncbi:hypothetical protein H4582DRAFT_257487 [Lactarius indigo]|nr:hypothetical protein H4582DRAFT_257487 [Lactarius indigo]
MLTLLLFFSFVAVATVLSAVVAVVVGVTTVRFGHTYTGIAVVWGATACGSHGMGGTPQYLLASESSVVTVTVTIVVVTAIVVNCALEGGDGLKVIVVVIGVMSVERSPLSSLRRPYISGPSTVVVVAVGNAHGSWMRHPLSSLSLVGAGPESVECPTSLLSSLVAHTARDCVDGIPPSPPNPIAVRGHAARGCNGRVPSIIHRRRARAGLGNASVE